MVIHFGVAGAIFGEVGGGNFCCGRCITFGDKDQSQESPFVAGAVFGDVGVSLFVAGAVFGEVGKCQREILCGRCSIW